jgi:class 3 adenylate cyclase
MTKNPTVYAKYIFLDIVKYSTRSVEGQTAVIKALNEIVEQIVNGYKIDADNTIYIPTGDGMCIGLINVTNPYDINIRISLDILKLINEYNKKEKDPMRKFDVRIGINENDDNLVTDINGKRNFAGNGINIAQRIMNCGDANMILVSASVKDRLSSRDAYLNKFKGYKVTIKHGEKITVYQFVDDSIRHLAVDIPSAIEKANTRRKNKMYTKPLSLLFDYISDKLKDKDTKTT